MAWRNYFSWSVTPAWAAQWEKIRQRGKRRYVLLQGVCFYGIPMFIFMTSLILIKMPAKVDDGFWILLAINLVVWGLGGALFGLRMWAIFEAGYWAFKGKAVPPE